MKTTTCYSHALLLGAALLLTPSIADARCYGMSRSWAGRGTMYSGWRGGSAYVGPRGFAAQGPSGRTVVGGERGAAYAGPEGAAAVGRYGGAAVAGPNGVAAVGRYGGAVVATRPAIGSYIRTMPVGYTTVMYNGYNCYFVGGIYYRPVFYGGETVYVVMN